MGFILFKNKKKAIEGYVYPQNQNVVKLLKSDVGNSPNTSGFTIATDAESENVFGNYLGFKTLYRDTEEFYELSNDGSIYVEPEVVEEIEDTEDIDNEVEVLEELNELEESKDDEPLE